MKIQQISTWQSIYGSEMGDLASLQVQGGGFDETILMTMLAQYKKPVFKKPYTLVQKFQVMPLARATSPAGSAISSMHLGVSAADYSQQSRAPRRKESPSLSAMDRQRTGHQSRDPTKKTLQSSVKRNGG